MEKIQITVEYFFKISFISFCALYLNYKILNIKEKNLKEKIIIIIKLIIINVFSAISKHISNSTVGIMITDIFIALIFSKNINKNIGYSLLITTISLSINYILYIFSAAINYVLFRNYVIQNRYIVFIAILLVDIILLRLITGIKRFNKGISFLKKNECNEYFGILILNISSTLFFAFIMINNFDIETIKALFLYIVIFSIIMFITIQKSLQLYYKQKLQEREVEEIKEELKNKDKEIEELEKENLKLNKKNHSIAHKQKSLEYQIEQITANNQMTNKNQVKDEIKNLSKEMQNETVSIELTKTGINEIDSMLKYMQSECIKNKIEFELQINGNIHHMINTYIGKEDLEILIADLIKNAIIAIQHSENSNKSILVRLGLIDGFYSLYVYDSGIEFEIDTLKNIGIKPSTTHAKEGGTGMGLINTFDAVRKYKASFIINELGKPVENNYTKVIKIIFDNNNKYEVMSYRKVNFRDSP